MTFKLIILLFILHNLTLFSHKITDIKEQNPNLEIFSLIDSSKLSPLYFSVQIGVFKTLIDSKNPITKYSLRYYKDNDLIKYFVGKYMNYSSALNMKDLLIKDGNPDVFIVCYGIKKNDNIASKDKLDIINEVELDSFIDTSSLVNNDTTNLYESINKEGFNQENYRLNDDTIQILLTNEEKLFQEKVDSNNVLSSVNFIEVEDEDFNFENAKEALNGTTQIDTNIIKIKKKINLDSIRKLDSIKIIRNKIQKFITLTNPSDPEQFMSNITYLDPKLRTSSISDSSEFEEVFYTIQLGAYSKPLNPPNYIFKFPLFMSEHNSLFKYCHGKFESLAEAKEKRDEFQLYGIYDAFIISYGIPSKDSYLYDKESKEIDLELDSLENSRIEKIKLNDPDAIFYSEKESSVKSAVNVPLKDSLKDLNYAKNIDTNSISDSLEKETSIKSAVNVPLKDSLKDLNYAKNIDTNSIRDSLEKETKKNNYRIIDLDYQVPNVYYIELGIFKSSQNTVMNALKIKLPYLNISCRKRFMGYQYYTKKYNSLLNAQKALDEIYENDINNARIIKSTSSQYKNNYEFRVLIDIANSINTKKIQDKAFLKYEILKGSYFNKINYFSLSRDDYNDVLNDQEFFKDNDFIKCKVVVFQNGKESTVEKANMEQKY